jgi:hypothetical protein
MQPGYQTKLDPANLEKHLSPSSTGVCKGLRISSSPLHICGKGLHRYPRDEPRLFTQRLFALGPDLPIYRTFEVLVRDLSGYATYRDLTESF